MCRFLLATLPSDTDIATLESQIPDGLRVSLLRHGLQDSWSQSHHLGFDIVENPNLAAQLPTDDVIVRLTRLHCDCWSTLARDQLARKEASRWRSIFSHMLLAIPRFGFVIHFGDPTDAFSLAGPVAVNMDERNPLNGLQLDTLYEILP